MLTQDEIDQLTSGYVDEEDRGSRGGTLIVVAAAVYVVVAGEILGWIFWRMMG